MGGIEAHKMITADEHEGLEPFSFILPVTNKQMDGLSVYLKPMQILSNIQIIQNSCFYSHKFNDFTVHSKEPILLLHYFTFYFTFKVAVFSANYIYTSLLAWAIHKNKQMPIQVCHLKRPQFCGCP